MKKIATGFLCFMFTFSFSGCGNGSSKGAEDATPKNTKYIPLTNCIDEDNIERYVILKSKDEIIADEENSTVLRYYSEKGVKRVCVMEGDAHIEREISE